MNDLRVCGNCGSRMGITERSKDFILYGTFAAVIVILFLEIRETAKGSKR